MDEIEILKSMLDHSHRIVFFTGAGISVPSGIPDFRSADGLYNQKGDTKYSPEQIISHSFYVAHKREFYTFYKDKMIYPNAKPNIAHEYIAKLQDKKDVIVVTQNIDGLHQEAGSKKVIELHGSVKRNYCERCGAFFDDKYVMNSKAVPVCDKCGGDIKPDVVLYEEQLDAENIDNAITAIMKADTMVVIGTSLVVYPAAGFIRYFKGNALIVINKDKTNYDNMCDLVINDDVAKVIKKLNEKEAV